MSQQHHIPVVVVVACAAILTLFLVLLSLNSEGQGTEYVCYNANGVKIMANDCSVVHVDPTPTTRKVL